MDGAKLATDTTEYTTVYKVDRRLAWVEARPQGCVDRAGMKILAIVGSEPCANHGR